MRYKNGILYFKDSISKMPLELQPEDGFIKKLKHVANMIFYLIFNYMIYNTGCVRLQTCIHFINYGKHNRDAST